MLWYAVFTPSGEILEGGVSSTVEWAWAACLSKVPTNHPFYREWYAHDFPGDSQQAVEALGYRCAEVEVIPTRKMDVIRATLDLAGLDMRRLEEWRNNPLPCPSALRDPQSLGYRLECDGTPPWTCAPRALNTSVLVEITVIGSPWRAWRDPLTGELHDGQVYWEQLQQRMGRG
jgi:hypothetical protein